MQLKQYTVKDQQELSIFERYILYHTRTRKNLWWRMTDETKNKQEVMEELEYQDIVSHMYLKTTWSGHVWISGQENKGRFLMEWAPQSGREKRGGPKSRWQDEVEEDLRGTGVKDWEANPQHRQRWRKLKIIKYVKSWMRPPTNEERGK